jgi:hypothetical protein
MTAAEILAIAADLAAGQFTVNKAVSAVDAFLSCYPAARAMLDAAVRDGDGRSLALILLEHATPAAVAAVIRAAASPAVPLGRVA